MKKMLLISMLIMILAISFISEGFSMGDRPPRKKAGLTKSATEVSKVTGKVTGCNLSNSTITVFTIAGSFLTISIDKNTKLFKGGKSVGLADIKSQDAVTVAYESKKGTNIAKSVIVNEKAPPVPTKTKGKR